MGQETSWTQIHRAVNGEDAARSAFAKRYETLVRRWFGARWRGHALYDSIDDASQEVFLQCFNGALERADPNRSGGFRAFFYGVIRKVAQRFEERRARELKRKDPKTFHAEKLESDETTLAGVFDRAWARALMKQTWELNEERAREHGDAHVKRIELLRLRFEEGLPIRDIARRWEADPVQVHRDYAKARKEFKKTLLEVVREHEDSAGKELEAKCSEILHLLGKQE